jgi:hypothetical protein
MLDIQAYPLREQDIASAADFLQQSMAGQGRLFGQLDAAWKEMHATRDAGRFLYVRYGVMEYMAAAYATRDRIAFDAAVDSMLAHPLPADDGWYRPTAAQLGADLAVALSCRQEGRAHALGRQILRDTPDDGAPVPEDWQARLLARLFDLDYDGAAEALARMGQVLDGARLPRHDAALLATWKEVAACVVGRTDVPLTDALRQMSQLRTAYVEKMLVRWRKGQGTDWSPLTFWDCQASALGVLARSLGMAQALAPTALPFADWQWTEGSRAWT